MSTSRILRRLVVRAAFWRRFCNPKAVLFAIAFVLPACDGFVCSQERIKAIELANNGAEAFKNNLYDTAEKDLKQSIATDPTYEIAYYNLGKVFQKQRKWDKAIEQFEIAAQKAPTNANYQYDLGEAYFESKKLDQAEKALEAATEADPKLFKAWWRLGSPRKHVRYGGNENAVSIAFGIERNSGIERRDSAALIIDSGQAAKDHC